MGQTMNVIKEYAVVMDMYSENDDDTIICKTYAEACQLASRVLTNREVEECFVVIHYQSDEPMYHA